MKSVKRKALWFSVLLFFAGIHPVLPAVSPAALEEYEIKAGFIFQFTKFIDWPETAKADGQFVIGILGDDPFGEALSPLETERVGAQPIVIKHFQSIQSVQPTDVLFISRSETPKLNEILSKTRKNNLLTISEIPGFISRGGIINFVKQGSRIRFEINQRLAEESGLKFSSKLLSLAERVIT